jgi:hypothetical protein
MPIKSPAITPGIEPLPEASFYIPATALAWINGQGDRDHDGFVDLAGHRAGPASEPDPVSQSDAAGLSRQRCSARAQGWHRQCRSSVHRHGDDKISFQILEACGGIEVTASFSG